MGLVDQVMVGTPLYNRVPQGTRASNYESKVNSLPLNLIATIVSYLDDVADLARVCRTCRVLNYMTTPHLYHSITLTSYEGVRYRDDVAEGSGSASPFAMGLNALVTKNAVHLVRNLTLRGEWKEHDLEECARVGRVPDNAMMLNIAVRAAIDRCVALESFTWDLNTKLLASVYGGLSNLPHLKSLRIRFPSSRTPRPTCLVPAMPNLENIFITDIDPLCYPDDISLLLASAKRLKHITLHFSPRMREQSEPSIHLEHYFRRFIALGKGSLKVQSMAFYNVFAKAPDGIDDIVDTSLLKAITDIRSTPPGASNIASFLDDSWKQSNPQLSLTWLRTDFINSKVPGFLESFTGLEKVYLVNQHNITLPSSPENSSTQPSPTVNGISSSGGNELNCARTETPPARALNTATRDSIIDALMTCHGQTLVHLALPTRWLLSFNLFARLVRSAPNLTQLSLAVDTEGFHGLRLFVPFLQKLRVLRLLVPTDRDVQAYGCGKPQSLQKIFEQDDSVLIPAVGKGMVDEDGRHAFPNLKYLILGSKAYELGHLAEFSESAAGASKSCTEIIPGVAQETQTGVATPSSASSTVNEFEQTETVKVKRRIVKRVDWDTVQDIEILKYDTRALIV